MRMFGPVVHIADEFAAVAQHEIMGIHVLHIESSIQSLFVVFIRYDDIRGAV